MGTPAACTTWLGRWCSALVHGWSLAVVPGQRLSRGACPGLRGKARQGDVQGPGGEGGRESHEAERRPTGRCARDGTRAAVTSARHVRCLLQGVGPAACGFVLLSAAQAQRRGAARRFCFGTAAAGGRGCGGSRIGGLSDVGEHHNWGERTVGFLYRQRTSFFLACTKRESKGKRERGGFGSGSAPGVRPGSEAQPVSRGMLCGIRKTVHPKGALVPHEPPQSGTADWPLVCGRDIVGPGPDQLRKSRG